MSGERHNLVSIDDVHATCGGYDISAIMELHLSAQANNVPTLTLLVDGGNSDGTGSFAADAVSLDAARDIFDNCRAMLKTSSATLSLSLVCRTVGRDGESTQSLRLDGWPLVDVALSPVRRDGVCAVALTFAHPLYMANLGGATSGLLAAPQYLFGIQGKNPLEIFISTLEAYAESPRLAMPPKVVIPGAASAADVEPVLRRHLRSAISALKSSVSWTGGQSLPALSVLSPFLQALWYGMRGYGTPSSGNSVLHSLLAGLIPECSLALGGDFTAKSLSLGPFTPWADPSVSIMDSDIVSLDLPQSDPAPISGVHFVTVVGGGGDKATFQSSGGQLGDGAKAVDVFYVPKSELDGEYMYGPVQQFSPPGWLVRTMEFASGRNARASSDSVTALGGSFSSAVSIPRDGFAFLGGGSAVVPALDFAKASMMCAKAYFETSYMKDWTFDVETRLMLSNEGGMLCPGRVMSVVTDSGEVIGGYINVIAHTIGVSSKTAATKIKCTHPRFGARPTSITSGENALYANN